MDLLQFFFVGYIITILIETPVLLIGLSSRHDLECRLFSGVWLTACTYPVVVLILPAFFDLQTQRPLYLIVAETFAPVVECLIFWVAIARKCPGDPRSFRRDMVSIVVANLASFGIGELGYIILGKT